MLRLGGALRRDPRARGVPLGRALRAGLASRSEAPVPLVVALDMDECLIHCTGFSQPSMSFRQHEESRPDRAAKGDGIEKLQLRLASGVTCSVLKRHGLDAFLSECCDMFETYVFTAGVEEYASAVLDAIDTERKLAGRLFRQHCRPVRTPVGDQFLKDLTAVAGRCRRNDVERIVLVDNNPLSFVLQPQNGIPVPDFVGQTDNIFPAVMSLLRRLDDSPGDVRSVLDPLFKLELRLESTRRQLLGGGGSKL